ncbi:hypothetical protein D9M73_186380 [compost metagenome]
MARITPSRQIQIRSGFAKAIEQVRFADQIQIALLVHCHAFGTRNGFFKAVEATQQADEADGLTVFIQLQQHMRVSRKCQGVPGTGLDGQCRQVAQVEFFS